MIETSSFVFIRDYTRQDLPSVENGRGVDPSVGLSLGMFFLVPFWISTLSVRAFVLCCSSVQKISVESHSNAVGNVQPN